MKKLTALLLTLVLALSLTACGSNESKQLVGTWQCTVDITSQMDTEIGGALDAEYASETPMQMFLTAVFNDDGTFTMGVDTDATAASFTAYIQALKPVIVELTYQEAEKQGMTREEYDKALDGSGLTVEGLVDSVLSAFALNIGVNVAKKYKKTVAIFNLEMSREQLAMRLLANEAFVELQKLATGKLNEDEWAKLCMASAALSQTDIRIDDNPSVTVADINAKCRRLDNLGLVIIDYLQLMQGSGYGKNNENRVVVVGEISRSLKIMAKELNVPVICLSQLSRAVESRTDKRPILSDLRESGAIEQDADSVMFLYRDEYYHENTEDKGIAECIVAKNRHGETGAVKLQWIGQYQTFADREWKHAE